MIDQPSTEAFHPNKPRNPTDKPPDVAHDRDTPHDQAAPMAMLRNANEQLTLTALQAQVEAEASAEIADHLGALVATLEASQAALQEKVSGMEMFHDVVMARELRLMHLEKENKDLRQEIAQLRSESLIR